MLAGFALRLYRLTAVPLRGDEAFSVQYWARLPLAESLSTIASIEPHPFLNYAIFHGWGLAAGTSEFSMRLLPALSNLIGIPALYALGKRLGGLRAGLLAAGLWAIHPLQIWYAQDVRNYAIWSGLSVVALWLGLRALRDNRPRDWILYALVAALAANIFYAELLTIAAFSLYGIITCRKTPTKIARLLAAQVIPITASLASFAILQGGLLNEGGYGGTTGPFDMAHIPAFLITLTFGRTLPSEAAELVWPLIVIASLAGLFLIWRKNRITALFLICIGFLPLLTLCLLALRLNIFTPQYVFATAPAYILIPAVVFGYYIPKNQPANPKLGTRNSELGTKTSSLLTHYASLFILIPILALTALALANYYFNPATAKAPNWPVITDYLRKHAAPGDLVIQLSADASFGYYYDAPALDIALPAEPQQPPEEIHAILADYSDRYRSIWLVGQTFPDWPNVGIVEEWVKGNMQTVLDTTADGLHIRHYLPWEVSENELNIAPATDFGIAELVGYQAEMPPTRDGDLIIQLVWKPVETTSTPLKIFVHLTLGENGPPISQDDQFPQDDRGQTSDWPPNYLLRDIYDLPLRNVPAGEYHLIVGFYDPASGERLPGGVHVVDSILVEDDS